MTRRVIRYQHDDLPETRIARGTPLDWLSPPGPPHHPQNAHSHSTQSHAMAQQTHDLRCLCRAVVGTGSLLLVTMPRGTLEPVSPQAGGAPGLFAQGRALGGDESRWSRLSVGLSENTTTTPGQNSPSPSDPFLFLLLSSRLPGLRAPCAYIGMVTSHSALSSAHLVPLVRNTSSCIPDPLSPLVNHCT